jgi:hypothetical protein
MSDLIRSLNREGEHHTASGLCRLETSRWICLGKYDALAGDLLFLAWDGKVRLVAPIRTFARDAVEVGRFSRVSIKSRFRGYSGFKYVDRVHKIRGADYEHLFLELDKAAAAYRRSSVGRSEISKAWGSVTPEERRVDALTRKSSARFRQLSREAPWKDRNSLQALKISQADRKRYF